eukprot:3257862-Lingulodinium_polyedra.AAC.1
MKSWSAWCSSKSGKAASTITMKQLLASLRAGKVKAGEDKILVKQAVLQSGAVLWVPPGWITARKLVNQTSGIALRKSVCLKTTAAVENLKAVAMARRAEPGRDAVEMALLDEIIKAAEVES